MKVVELKHPYQETDIVNEPIVLVLGFFDGVHLGHQRVINTAREIADEKGLKLAVMTFDRHPKMIYQKLAPEDYQYVTLAERRIELLAEFGVDYCYLVEFSHEFGAQDPQTFVDNYIVGLHADTVVAGFDYTYGPREAANMDTLPAHARGRFDVVTVPKRATNGHKVGTRYISKDIKEGNIEVANRDLGHTFQTKGEVIHGFKRGREIGYPTANIKAAPEQLLPGIGVYVSEVEVDGVWYQAMTSVGYNVTFDDVKDLSVEAYILDFDEMIYGKIVRVKWHKYLRNELKFDGLDGLIEQLDQDLMDTRAYFSGK